MRVNEDGWIDEAIIVPSVRHEPLLLPRPIVLVQHATATKASAAALSRRIRSYRRHLSSCPPGCKEHDRASSWHLIGAVDGALWQSVSLNRGAWHCATPVKAGGLRWRRCNQVSIGLEWQHPGPAHGKWEPYTEAQRDLWRRLRPALWTWSPELEQFGHFELDPARRSDPGRDWLAWLRTH